MSLEQDVRDYLRSRPALMLLLDSNVSQLNMEFQGPLKFNHVTLFRAGGAAHDYMPLETAPVQFHCFGATRPVASQIADQLALEMRRITAADTPLLSASVESINWLPTSDDVARYVVITVVTARIPVLAA